MKNFFIINLLFITLYSCGGFEDAGKVLRNEKTKNTDEFLVKKKDPLILPPDYDKIPTPDSKIKNIDDKRKLKNILKAPREEIIKSTDKSKSLEKKILEKIR
tara:strand:- start:418 stop:723 length:306 start_codon:yes stop_codon:yes gene_type:complete